MRQEKSRRLFDLLKATWPEDPLPETSDLEQEKNADGFLDFRQVVRPGGGEEPKALRLAEGHLA